MRDFCVKLCQYGVMLTSNMPYEYIRRHKYADLGAVLKCFSIVLVALHIKRQLQFDFSKILSLMLCKI